MGRLLSIAVVVLLVLAVWAILVAPNYDLDPTTLRGKLAILGFLCAALVAASSLGNVLLLRRLPPSCERISATLPSLLDLTCCRLC